MKKILILSFCICCAISSSLAQAYLPIPTTGYNFDAVAENTTAVSTTSGPIDGSNYVLYSVAYGLIVGGGTTYGLPNNGLIAAGTRTYQLQGYTGNNTLYLPAMQADTLLVTTPAPFPAVSLCAFATEGTGLMTVKLRFTDGTSQTFSSITLDDWFATAPTNTVITGIDRCNRPAGTPNYNGVNPRIFRIDLNLSCANRLKNLQKLIISNNGSNPRLCIMAVSGGISATYSVNTSPVTCAGGNNGSATLTVNNGVPPFTYSWSTTPIQSTAIVNLPAGVATYTVTDASTCAYTSTVNITQAIVPDPPLVIVASQNPVCTGATLTLTTSGASTYTWSNNTSGNSTSVTVNVNTLFSVVATTTANCTLTGNITVSTTPLPVITFTSIPTKLCLNAQGIPLTASPGGGNFNGQGISFGNFFPTLAGAGTQTISYTFTDPNGCTSVNVVTTTISTPTTVIAFAVTPATVCTSGPAIQLTATPPGGTYAGQGVVGSLLTPSLAGAGTFTVSYSFTDANNCSASKISSIIVKVCQFVGINETTKSLNCELFPNPNNGSFIITTDTDLRLNIVNELGQTIRELDLNNNNEHSANVENLPAGIYFLSSAGRLLNQKIIVTR
ncbi:MAG: T9SS type A sorting domain-containing protein [Bacteroidota bacterium]